jgi:DNA-binding NarL/FixJ family response regulator
MNLDDRPQPPDWSSRQLAIVELISAGLSDKQIAIRLGISTGTVKTHLRRLYRTKGVPNRAAAVAQLVVRHPPGIPHVRSGAPGE